MKGKETNSCGPKCCCNKMDIADVVKDLFYNGVQCLFFH